MGFVGVLIGCVILIYVDIRSGKQKDCRTLHFVYRSAVASQKPIPVRLSEDLIKRIDRAAKRMGTNRASIMRLCTEVFVESFEKNGTAALPLDWEKLIQDADGRRSENKS